MLYPCKWGLCSSTFPSRNAYINHLNKQHLNDANLDREVGFVHGRFRDWLRVTGRQGGSQSTADDQLESPPPKGRHGDAKENASRPTARSRAVVYSSDSEGNATPGKFRFKALSREAGAPVSSPTSPIPSVNPSPSPSALASRAQSHVPNLSPSPASQQSSGNPKPQNNTGRSHSRGPARKRRRVSDATPDPVVQPASSPESVPVEDRHAASTCSSQEQVSGPSHQSESESNEAIELALTQDENDRVDREDCGIAGISESYLERLVGEAGKTRVTSMSAEVGADLVMQPADGSDCQRTEGTRALWYEGPERASDTRAETRARSSSPLQPVEHEKAAVPPPKASSWSPSHRDRAANLKTYVPRFKSGVLDIAGPGGVHSQRSPPSVKRESDEARPEPLAEREQGPPAQPPQAGDFAPSQLQLMTQAPYHYPSQDSL